MADMEKLNGKVAVVTGASSGIGRSTAIELTKLGANVVLAGRDGQALREAEQDCADYPGQTATVTCDVTDQAQVERLADRAEEIFGHIDIWVNNAGVNLYGAFEETPSDEFRRVIDTDFFGYVYGARAAIKRFKTKGSGALIHVDAPESRVPAPFNSAYTAAKHAVRAVESSLRMELLMGGYDNISISAVVPSAVDTPMYAHAANRTGLEMAVPQTAIPAGAVAKAVARLAIKPQRELVIGGAPNAQAFSFGLMPAAYEKGVARGLSKRPIPSSVPTTKGNLFEATGPHAVSSGQLSRKPSRQTLKTAGKILLTTGLALGAGALVTLFALPTARKMATGRP